MEAGIETSYFITKWCGTLILNRTKGKTKDRLWKSKMRKEFRVNEISLSVYIRLQRTVNKTMQNNLFPGTGEIRLTTQRDLTRIAITLLNEASL